MSNTRNLLGSTRTAGVSGPAGALTILLLALAATAPPLAAQDSLTYAFVGSVFDARSGDPVVAAFAAVLGTERFATTDQNGSFRIDGIPPGQQVVRIWRLGYEPTMFRLMFDSVEVNVLDAPIVLEPIPVQMPEVVVEADRTRLVTGPMRDFYRRRNEGEGWFLTREQIEARSTDQFVELVRMVPGADIQYLGNLQNAVRLAPTCGPVYYVDGARTNEQLVLSLQPQHLAGIEVYYRAATVPPEFNVPDAACGVIVAWTYH
jgi:hypothetical protein